MGSQVGEAYKGRLQQGSEAVPWFQRGTRGCFVVYRMREAFRSVLARWRQLSLATRSPSTPQPRSLQDEVGQPRQRWVVARDAPQEFRDLVHDLLLLKDILFIVHRKVTRDPDLYGDPTKRVLQCCFDALSDFSTLVAKYEKLALSDRGHWFRRLQWSREQDSINACHVKLQKYQALLNLVLTPEGRTVLSEEQTEDVNPNPHLNWPDSFSLVSEEQYNHRDGPRTSFSQASRSRTVDSSATLLPSSASHPALQDRSPWLSKPRSNGAYLEAGLGGSSTIQNSLSQNTCLSSRSGSFGSVDSPLGDQNFLQRASDASVDGRLRKMSLNSLRSDDSAVRTFSENTILQPLEIPEQRARHDCPTQVEQVFMHNFEAIGDEVLDESWIRIATWWLLKSQAVFLRSAAALPVPFKSEGFQVYGHWEDTTSQDQACADLLKSSWIVEELIRKRKVAGDLTKRQPRKLVIDLLKALKTDLHRRQHDKSCKAIPDTAVLLNQDLSLLESFEQTVETKEGVPQAMDDLTTAHRWITIDKDHGGFEHEKVMFRCWVNAQIGQRDERSKSSNAPYMIILWTKAGESEIFVSLVNQKDTLNLSRKLTAEDLEDWESMSQNSTAMQLEFPSQPAEVNFLAPHHFQLFCEGPKQFFDAVKGRDPQVGELTIFKTVLKSYRNTDPSDPNADHKSFDSCELRVYERMDETCWKTTRRLVVSSAADSKKLGCVSHWLPISNVRIQVEDNTVTVRWSDCGHLEKKNQGNYNPYYSYVYQHDSPNQKIILVFSYSEDAQRFEDCLLYMTETPPQVRLTRRIENPSAFQETRLFSLFDPDDPDKGYHGIVYAKKSPKSHHVSQIFYVYRDLDFSFPNQDPTVIDFRNVRVPHYLSNLHKMLAMPKEREVVPEFREVTWMKRTVQMTFSCDEDAIKFLHGLTGWRLKFHRQCARLVVANTSHFRISKTTYKGAEIQLWEKTATEGGQWTQLVARLLDTEKPWLTTSLEITGGGVGLPTGGVAELKNLAVQQGADLDTKYMKANVEDNGKSKPCWKLTVTFKETNAPGFSNTFPNAVQRKTSSAKPKAAASCTPNHRRREHRLETFELASHSDNTGGQRKIYKCLTPPLQPGNTEHSTVHGLPKHFDEQHAGRSDAVSECENDVDDRPHPKADEQEQRPTLTGSSIATSPNTDEVVDSLAQAVTEGLQRIPCSGAKTCNLHQCHMGSVAIKTFVTLYERVAPEALSLRSGKQYVTQLKEFGMSCLNDDIVELRPGAACDLKTSLHSAHRQRPTGQQSTSSASTYAGEALNVDTNGCSASPSACLPGPDGSSLTPLYNPCPTNGRPTSAAITCGPESEWLLVCARPISLLHRNVCSTTSDQQLFTELRQLYVSLKKAWWHRLTLKVVRSIKYVQFELHPRDLVDVRKVPDMPPEGKREEYVYQACDLIPPIGENLMTHLFHHPHEANEKAITLQRSPKKRKERLAICPQMGTNVGWGIQLVENWAMTKVWLLACTIFVLSGLIFAIAWSVLKHDLQGAFGVAAFFTTLAGLAIGTVQAYINQP
ncbi:MAG: hypothetical protein LQ345_005585 [Seirophora villosa]|nr:MAG: hypothetical protein LQ345_005585 [Seirophora villosa]